MPQAAPHIPPAGRTGVLISSAAGSYWPLTVTPFLEINSQRTECLTWLHPLPRNILHGRGVLGQGQGQPGINTAFCVTF